MKRILLMVFSMGLLFGASAQDTIFHEFFTTVPVNSVPANWMASSNTDVHNYQRPFADCIAEKGLETPAVGKSAPVRLVLPPLQFHADSPDLFVSFKVYVMDPNLECASAKKFPCQTFVTVYLVKADAALSVSHLPAPVDIYASQSYEIRNANADNTVIFDDLTIPDGASYRIYLDFKTAATSNCTGSGTKFVFDDFIIQQYYCDNCPPVANDDYFDGNRQAFVNTVYGNVYGGFLKWASVVREGYERASLTLSPAVANGLDYSVNNYELSQMRFDTIGDPVVENVQCSDPSPAGTLHWYGDGSFDFTRENLCVNRIVFVYKITDPLGMYDTAKVIIDFVPNAPLPVQFASFTAARNGNAVQLKWQTASEQNVNGFIVQRNTGNRWTNQGFVFSNASGSSASTLSYEFKETNTFTGVTQYRLAEQDYDGSLSFSEVRTVRGTSQADKLLVYPNPSNTGSVNILLPKTSVYEVVLTDGSGRELKHWRKMDSEALTINSLSAGIYLVRVTDVISNVTTTSRFVVTGGMIK